MTEEKKSVKKKEIEQLSKELAQTKKDYQNREQSNLNVGLTLPVEMQEEYKHKCSQIELQIGAKKEELKAIQDHLDYLAKIKEEQERKKILPRGPRNARSGGANSLVIDGQRTAKLHGILCITEPHSPYCGMAILDYVERVVKPWKTEQSRRERKQRKNIIQERVKDQVRALGLDPSPVKWHDYGDLRTPSLPAWPEGVRNFRKWKPEEQPGKKESN